MQNLHTIPQTFSKRTCKERAKTGGADIFQAFTRNNTHIEAKLGVPLSLYAEKENIYPTFTRKSDCQEIFLTIEHVVGVAEYYEQFSVAYFPNDRFCSPFRRSNLTEPWNSDFFRKIDY